MTTDTNYQTARVMGDASSRGWGALSGEPGYEEEQRRIEAQFQAALGDVEEQFREEKARERAGLPPSDLDDDEPSLFHC